MSDMQVSAAVFPDVMPENDIHECLAEMSKIKSNLRSIYLEIFGMHKSVHQQITKMVNKLRRNAIGPVCRIVNAGFVETPEIVELRKIDDEFHTMIQDILVRMNKAIDELREDIAQWPAQVPDVVKLKTLMVEERKELIKSFKDAETTLLGMKLFFKEILKDFGNLKVEFRKMFKECLELVTIIVKDFKDEDKENRGE